MSTLAPSRSRLAAAALALLSSCASVPGAPCVVRADPEIEAALAAWLLSGPSPEPGTLRAAAAADLAPLASHPLVEEARTARRDGRSINAWIGECLDRGTRPEDSQWRSFLESDRLRAFRAASAGSYRRSVDTARFALDSRGIGRAARARLEIPPEREIEVAVSLVAPAALGVAVEREDRLIAVVSPRLRIDGRFETGVRPRFELSGVVLHELAHPAARRALDREARTVGALERRLGALAVPSGLDFRDWIEENVSSAAACACLADAISASAADDFEREEERRGLVLVPEIRGAIVNRPDATITEATPEILGALGRLDAAPLERRARLLDELRRARVLGPTSLAALVARYPSDVEPRFALAEALFQRGETAGQVLCSMFRDVVASPAAGTAPDLVRLARKRLQRLER